jgi:ribA/ribD-fused uncharacterized protein
MIIDNKEFNCCEQWMMYNKAMVFKDYATAQEVMEAEDPSHQKALGREVVGFDKKTWDSVCLSIVYRGNLAKFSQNEELKNQLLSTGDKIIVEASPHDPVWGIGMSESKGVEDPSNWRGLNLLGQAIMLVRNELR